MDRPFLRRLLPVVSLIAIAMLIDMRIAITLAILCLIGLSFIYWRWRDTP